VPDGDVVDMTQLIHPKVEAEIAFVTARELSGDVSIDEVLAATEFVLPAIEVIDSRFKDFKFDVQSVIADNTSAARYVVGGAPRRPDGLDLRLLGVVMERNGELVGTAAGAAVMGHPAASVVALVRWLADSGQALPAGSLVMTGGVTEAVAVHSGDHVTARVQDLGTVGVRFS
jgi:2-oxo-3-hexenedioate decarboxylase